MKPRRKRILLEVARDPGDLVFSEAWAQLTEQQQLESSEDILRPILFQTLPTVTTRGDIDALLPHRLTPELLKIPAPVL